MKFMMNGAVTIGTLDGANVEILEEVGNENFFLFGLTVEGVQRLRAEGYRPEERYEADAELRDALDALSSGVFSGGDREVFRPVVENLVHHDPFLVLADYRAYVDAQAAVEEAWRHEEGWTRASILNVARSGRFSSDRAIREYCREIWNVEPLPVPESGESA